MHTNKKLHVTRFCLIKLFTVNPGKAQSLQKRFGNITAVKNNSILKVTPKNQNLKPDYWQLYLILIKATFGSVHFWFTLYVGFITVWNH